MSTSDNENSLGHKKPAGKPKTHRYTKKEESYGPLEYKSYGPFGITGSSEKELHVVRFNRNDCDTNNYFAHVKHDKVIVYEYQNKEVKKIYSYPEQQENGEKYTTCAWSINANYNNAPVLVVGGELGKIRVFSTVPLVYGNHLQDGGTELVKTGGELNYQFSIEGHSEEISDLKFHPVEALILLSASEDKSLILWNIKTRVKIIVFSGHKAGVLSIDFHIKGNKIVSSDKIQTIKVWPLMEHHKEAMNKSGDYTIDDCKSFETIKVDDVLIIGGESKREPTGYALWFGDIIVSRDFKQISFLGMEPMTLKFYESEDIEKKTTSNDNISRPKFDINQEEHIIALGNSKGELCLIHAVDKPVKKKIKSTSSKLPINDCTISRNGNIIVTVSVDGSIYVWIRNEITHT